MIPSVSVLIPCYNAERFIGEAIESGLNQTHTNIEIVVVDDGSTDETMDVVRSFGDRIKFETGLNQGACVARNRAFELSSGKFIQFLDADDKLDPRKIERQLPLLLNEKADVVLCKFGLFGDHKGERAEKRPHPEPTGDPFVYFHEFPIGTPAALYHREIVQRSGGFSPGLKRGQEADFHLRVAALNPRLAMLDEILVWVRMHDGERITNRPTDINQVVETWVNIANYIDKHQTWTEPRQQLVARTLLGASRSCYASGKRNLAIKGLKRAVSVYPKITTEDRLARRLLTSLLGVTTAEKMVHFTRRGGN